LVMLGRVSSHNCASFEQVLSPF